jgi:phage FluMu gp28-like protein
LKKAFKCFLTKGGTMGAKMQPLIPLLPYQQRWVEDKSRFKLVNKARQTGFSFAVSLEVLLDALERKTLWVLLSKGERQSRELMDKVQMHAKAASYALDVIEADFKVGKDSYKQLELNLPNGSRIIALPANPDTARGFSGNVVLDEFAFHADSKAIWAALYPTITRGYKLRIISTPNGVGNQFEKLVSDPDNNWSKHEVDIYLAVSEGLDLNIEELRREAGSEDTWLQEYCCKFLDESSSFLTFDLINGCSDGKVARNLPELIDPAAQLYLGFDVARKKHLSVIWLLEKAGERYNTICVKEMQGMKFRDQRQLLYTFLDLPNLYRACIDATGIGAQLAEDAKLDYGYKVEPVMFTGASKEDMAVHIRGLFEDRLITIPKDDKIRDDLHSVKKVVTSGGNVRYVAPETDDGHADRFWALALAAHAGRTKWQSGKVTPFKIKY